MIPHDERIEAADSKPIARRFQSPELAHAYILGLEDGMRALGAKRILGTDPHEMLRSLWRETKHHHSLNIADPKG